MKKIKIMLIVFILMLINYENVLAECSSEEVQVLKEKASNIEIKLELQENVEGEFGYYDTHNLIINNMTEEFFIYSEYDGQSYGIRDANSEGQIIFVDYMFGKHLFKIYSQKCGMLISIMEVDVPRYNSFFKDPLCEGISGDDLAVCNKWYDGDLNYESFKSAVENYKRENNEDEKDMKSFISDNVLKILVLSGAVILMIVVLVVLRKRRGSELK